MDNVSTYVKLMLFCCKIGFVAIYAVLSQFTLFCRKICFVMIHTLLCGEKLNQKLQRKNDKYQVWSRPEIELARQYPLHTGLSLSLMVVVCCITQVATC